MTAITQADRDAAGVSQAARDHLPAYLMAEIDGVVRDMSTHVGDQIFDVVKRHGLMMRSEAAATAMQVLAAIRVLRQAVDQCSRAAEEDCTAAVARLFAECLPDDLRAHFEAQAREAGVKAGIEAAAKVADASIIGSPATEFDDERNATAEEILDNIRSLDPATIAQEPEA